MNIESKSIDLSVLIVNWNNKELLNKCLASIFKFTRDLKFEVIVFDNGSEDGAAELVRNNFPQVILIPSAKNEGFVKGNIEAFKRSSGKYLLLLNNDTELRENSFLKMIALFKTDHRIGVVGPKLLYADGTLQPSCRSFPDLWSQILILLKLHNFFPNLAPLRNYYLTDFDYQKSAEVDQVMGACFLTSREVVKRVGFLDPHFWSWFEEVDFCARVKDNGYKVIYDAGAAVIHQKGQSFKNLARRQIVFNRSLLHYFRKHRPYWNYVVLFMLQPISLILALGVNLILKFVPLKKNQNL